MNPITILYKLKLKGFTLGTVARELKTSRQLVRYAIMNNPQRGRVKDIQNRIDEILNEP